MINDDGGEQHSVTSEASPNASTSGAVDGVSFNTGAFTGTRSFALPSSAPNGTVVPYFCTVHLNTMTTPNGSITNRRERGTGGTAGRRWRWRRILTYGRSRAGPG